MAEKHMVHLSPRLDARNNLRNRGQVVVVMNYGAKDKDGNLEKPKRLQIGYTPVDVSGCRDPALQRNLDSGKLCEPGKGKPTLAERKAKQYEEERAAAKKAAGKK